MDISLDIEDANSTFSMCVNNILLEETLSHFFHLWNTYCFMTKKDNCWPISLNFFSRFHKIKTRTNIKDLRHSSLHTCMKCISIQDFKRFLQVLNMISKMCMKIKNCQLL